MPSSYQSFSHCLSIIFALYSLAYIIWTAFSLPTVFYLNPLLAVAGFSAIAFGACIFAWSFKVFPPGSVLGSTANTILWFVGKKKAASAWSGLVKTGPYAHVRHPICSRALFIALGLGMLFGFLLLAAAFAVLWFNIVIHFEEKELAKKYGSEYERYKKNVPKLVPWRLSNRHS